MKEVSNQHKAHKRWSYLDDCGKSDGNGLTELALLDIGGAGLNTIDGRLSSVDGADEVVDEGRESGVSLRSRLFTIVII